jgi:formylglycine-generating enzyme required for sulfatase activity
MVLPHSMQDLKPYQDRLSAIYRLLALQPAGWMLIIGTGLGACIGVVAFFWIGGITGIFLCLLAASIAIALGFWAEPVLVPSDVPKEHGWREPLQMLDVKGGPFLMGSPDSDDLATTSEKPQHPVTVSSFRMSRYPVTRQLYRQALATTPSEWEGDTDDDLLPANDVSWFDAVEFCNALSEQQGLQPCYRVERTEVTWNLDADGYRLPTEAEWEYAMRAGTITRWFFGDDETGLDRYAWFSGNSGGRIHPVGEKEPNP